ncbi:phosphopyruvate hydratase [Patescibacteria group bacterium]
MSISKIKSIKAKEILDSRGKPTIEVELKTDSGIFLSSVPSGTSKGKYEAVEKKAKIAKKNVNEVIASRLIGKDATKQKQIDEFLIKLDGTKRKSRLGANAILGVSMAVCRAGAKANNLALWEYISKIARIKPCFSVPCLLFFESGLHGKRILDVQEFMGFVKVKSFQGGFKTGKKIYSDLGKALKRKFGKSANVLGMEGGFLPPVSNIEEVLDLLVSVSKEMKIVLDVAASSFYKKNKYHFQGKKLKTEELLAFYLKLIKKYPISFIEDPFAEDDWQGWKMLKSKVLRIGDDLTVTNLNRIKLALNKEACDGIVIKPNQIGTVSETIAAAKYAKEKKSKVFIKHRSGETKDDFIADLAIGLGADFIMTGGPSKPERMAKYDRLLEIAKNFKK